MVFILFIILLLIILFFFGLHLLLKRSQLVWQGTSLCNPSHQSFTRSAGVLQPVGALRPQLLRIFTCRHNFSTKAFFCWPQGWLVSLKWSPNINAHELVTAGSRECKCTAVRGGIHFSSPRLLTAHPSGLTTVQVLLQKDGHLLGLHWHICQPMKKYPSWILQSFLHTHRYWRTNFRKQHSFLSISE